MRVQLTVAGFSVAVEAVSAMAEILSDDVLTGGRGWTLMPSGRAFVHICTHPLTVSQTLYHFTF